VQQAPGVEVLAIALVFFKRQRAMFDDIGNQVGQGQQRFFFLHQVGHLGYRVNHRLAYRPAREYQRNLFDLLALVR
jgi:hypothetical protein